MKETSTYTLPSTGFVRIRDVLRILPVGKSTLWKGVSSGRYPAPIRISEKCVAWEAEKIHQLIADLKLNASSHTPKNLIAKKQKGAELVA